MVQSGDCAAHRPKRNRRLQAAAARGVFRKAVKFASSFELLGGPESIPRRGRLDTGIAPWKSKRQALVRW